MRYARLFKDSLGSDDDDQKLADFCYSAGARKEHHHNRLVVLGRSGAQLRSRLTRRLADENASDGIIQGKSTSSVGDITFVFTGQGAQWWQMGRRTLWGRAHLSRPIDSIDALLTPLALWSLVDEMMNPESRNKLTDSSDQYRATSDFRGLRSPWPNFGNPGASYLPRSLAIVSAKLQLPTLQVFIHSTTLYKSSFIAADCKTPQGATAGWLRLEYQPPRPAN